MIFCGRHTPAVIFLTVLLLKQSRGGRFASKTAVRLNRHPDLEVVASVIKSSR
jgi:hypothetical protein